MNAQDLHGYQVAGIDHILTHTHCGLFLDMGLGKTVTTLTALKYLMYEDLDIGSALVIAPKRVVENVWEQECAKWEHLRGLKVSRVVGTEKQRKSALAVKADIYLLGRDNVSWLCGVYGGSMLPFDMLVIDESSSFKNPQAVRFKALKRVQPSFKRVVALTGTPAPNGLLDLWSQIYLLDRGERLGKYITNYRDQYFKPAQRNGAIVYSYSLNKNGEELIHERIKDICISMKASDYLQLPGRINNIIRLPFPAELQKQYNDFEREQVLQMFEGTEDITALNAAALSNKLLQFANGAVYDKDKNYHEIHDLKIEALEEILEDANGQPVLVAWTYRHDLYRIQEKLKKYKPRELKTEQDVLDWNAGKIQLLCMHPASGGHGLNLQTGGHILVWFGQTWALELYQQFTARLDRQGQTKAVIVHHLVASNTLDGEVLRSLESKEAKQESLLAAVKAKIAKYLKH